MRSSERTSSSKALSTISRLVFRRDVDQIERHLSQWDMLEPLGCSTYREAAAIFRLGRAKGFSLTTIDTLIAAIALDHRAILFTVDQDFSRIARITRLQLHSNY